MFSFRSKPHSFYTFFNQFLLGKPVCEVPTDLLTNWSYLSELINSTRFLRDWIEIDTIKKLNVSKALQPKELQNSIENVVEKAYAYYSVMNIILDNATEILDHMNDVINADKETFKIVETKLAALDDHDKLRAACSAIDIVEGYLKDFVKRVNVTMKTFCEIVAPFLSKINEFIIKLKSKYNMLVDDIDTAKLEIEDFINLLKDEIANTEPRMQIVNDDLIKTTHVEGSDCEKYLHEIQVYFEELLN